MLTALTEWTWWLTLFETFFFPFQQHSQVELVEFEIISIPTAFKSKLGGFCCWHIIFLCLQHLQRELILLRNSFFQPNSIQKSNLLISASWKHPFWTPHKRMDSALFPLFDAWLASVSSHCLLRFITLLHPCFIWEVDSKNTYFTRELHNKIVQKKALLENSGTHFVLFFIHGML